MYLNQNCCVKSNSKSSTAFCVSNGVKQGAVISPLFLNWYMDALFERLKRMLLAAMLVQFMLVLRGINDDIALVVSSLYSLKCMIATCEIISKEHQINFNPTKSK